MDPNIVFARTRKGHEELETRRYHLPQPLRIVLILVDGESKVGALFQKPGAPEDLEGALASLAIDGFIKADTPSWQPIRNPRSRTVAGKAASIPRKAKLIDIAIMVLGSEKAGKVVKKIEAAEDTDEALRVAVRQSKKLVSLAIDQTRAQELETRCLALLDLEK